ncbi:MAG: pilin [Candidatus Falkowbacteria bacterium]
MRFKIFFAGLFLFIFGLAGQALAGPVCGDNTDDYIGGNLVPPFTCEWVDDAPCKYVTEDERKNCVSDRQNKVINSASCSRQCDGTSPDPNFHCRCVRLADCKDTGGQCLNKSNQSEAATIDDLINNQGYVVITNRCPYGADFRCYVPPSKKSTLPVPAAATTLTPVVPAASGGTQNVINISLNSCCPQIVPPNSSGNYSTADFVQVAVNVYMCILCFIGALMLLMIVVGGFYMLTSAGDPGKVGTGKKVIVAAIVGGIIVFASYLIVSFVIKLLGGVI